MGWSGNGRCAVRGVLVTAVVAAGVLATPAPGFGEGTEPVLGVRTVKVRLHRFRGLNRDRMVLRASFPALQGAFDARRDLVDLVVAGQEVLCVPGWDGDFTDPDDPSDPVPTPPPPSDPYYPTPIDPGTYGPPGSGDPAPPREWTLREDREGRFLFRSDGRSLRLDLVRGTMVARGRDLDLDGLSDAGPGSVDFTLVLGAEQFATVLDLAGRGRVWTFRAR
jgi:hypothetical protein